MVPLIFGNSIWNPSHKPFRTVFESPPEPSKVVHAWRQRGFLVHSAFHRGFPLHDRRFQGSGVEGWRMYGF